MRPGSRKGRDVLRNHSEKADRRNQIWAHNACKGSVRMAQVNMRNIMERPTCTDESKALAFAINNLLEQLATSLLTRKDQLP